MTVQWTETDRCASVRIGQLGSLLVRQLTPAKRRTVSPPGYEVVVFGTALKVHSPTIEEGKARAIAAARVWIEAARRKLRPDPCPKQDLISGCDWPECDCGQTL